MLPMVARSLPFVQFVTNIARQASRSHPDARERNRKSPGEFHHPACEMTIEDGIIIRGHAAARAMVGQDG
jgi:hypothetical protein